MSRNIALITIWAFTCLSGCISQDPENAFEPDLQGPINNGGAGTGTSNEVAGEGVPPNGQGQSNGPDSTGGLNPPGVETGDGGSGMAGNGGGRQGLAGDDQK